MNFRRGACAVGVFLIAVSLGGPAHAQSLGGPDAHLPDLTDLPPDTRSVQERAFERSGGLRGLPRTAAGWKDHALALASQREYAGASDSFRQAAKIYRTQGDENAAEVLEVQAQRYETQLQLFYERPTRADSIRHDYSGCRLEPAYGCYLGAFIDREDGLSTTYADENSQTHKEAHEFNDAIGRRHAIFFMYNAYGKDFPEDWVDHLREDGAAAQWVLSPDNLNDVRDDDYLRGLAEQARAARLPIFLRFAGEMNGDWVSYHGDPALYIEKFRLVAKVFHAVAPNVAMVWCPNDLPQRLISEYYPGDDAVDWVGINFYSVYFNDNDPKKPVYWRNPSDNLDYIYKTYSARHPIMIGECAATHFSKADGQPRIDFAVDKIGQLYASLPRKYPRIKAVNWFSMNAIKYAEPGRRLNDYALLEDDAITRQYRTIVSSGYFLGSVRGGAVAPREVAPLTSGATVSGSVALSAWVKTYEERPTVTYSVNGKPVKSLTMPGDYAWTLNTRALPDGPAKIGVDVQDSTGKIAAHQEISVVIDNTKAVPVPIPPAPPVPPAPAVPKKHHHVTFRGNVPAR